MPKQKLTDRGLDALPASPPGTRLDIMDTEGPPGFGVRVNEKGEKVFILVARYPGKPNPARRVLGVYMDKKARQRAEETGSGPDQALSLKEAREKARQWRDLIRSGVDPRFELERKRAQEAQRRKNTFESVAEDYIRLALIGPNPERPKQKTGVAAARELRAGFKRYNNRPIDGITSQDILEVTDEKVAQEHPYMAHNLLGHVRRMFNWAIARGVYGVERSPCDRMKPSKVIGKTALRDRVLREDELRAFWRASERLGYPFGPLFQILALTGQRKSEVAEARWSEFDFARKLWLIPKERMKNGVAHSVPLTPAVIAILDALPRFQRNEYLFTTSFGRGPVSGFSKAKIRLDKLMAEELGHPVEPGFVIHDIRRTMRTGLSALPIPDLVRELVIAHAKPGLHQVYDQHAYLDEKRHALELWAGRLRDIVEPPPENNVVPLQVRA